MARQRTKHSEEALAFWTLFKAMKPEVKKEVHDIIVYEAAMDDVHDLELSTDMMTAISVDAFRNIWDAPENDHWDDFIKNRLQCSDKEI